MNARGRPIDRRIVLWHLRAPAPVGAERLLTLLRRQFVGRVRLETSTGSGGERPGDLRPTDVLVALLDAGQDRSGGWAETTRLAHAARVIAAQAGASVVIVLAGDAARAGGDASLGPGGPAPVTLDDDTWDADAGRLVEAIANPPDPEDPTQISPPTLLHAAVALLTGLDPAVAPLTGLDPAVAPPTALHPTAGPATATNRLAADQADPAATPPHPASRASDGLAVGAVFAGHRIDSLVKAGGMGVVYRATHRRLARLDAIKLIAPVFAGDPTFRERFEREAHIAASLDHPHVVPVYDAGEDDGRLYLVMRYIDGVDLSTLLANGPLSRTLAAELTRQIASGLDAAHEKGLVHRDVKPANVLVTGRPGAEHAYLTDFGAARSKAGSGDLTRTGTAIGTVGYSAPEQLEGKPVDLRADVYSLGCVLFAMLTGREPYPKDSDAAKIVAHLHQPPPSARAIDAAIPSAFDAVIAKAMDKDPAARYATAGELADAALAAATIVDERPTRIAASPGRAPRATRLASAAPIPAAPTGPGPARLATTPAALSRHAPAAPTLPPTRHTPAAPTATPTPAAPTATPTPAAPVSAPRSVPPASPPEPRPSQPTPASISPPPPAAWPWSTPTPRPAPAPWSPPPPTPPPPTPGPDPWSRPATSGSTPPPVGPPPLIGTPAISVPSFGAPGSPAGPPAARGDRKTVRRHLPLVGLALGLAAVAAIIGVVLASGTSPPWPTFHFAGYRASFPPGWHARFTAGPDGAAGPTRARLTNPAGTRTIVIDRTPHDTASPQQAAASVMIQAAGEAGYRTLRFRATTVAGRPAWEWEVVLPAAGSLPAGERVDYFIQLHGAVYATLGVGGSLTTIAPLARQVAGSIRAGS